MSKFEKLCEKCIMIAVEFGYVKTKPEKSMLTAIFVDNCGCDLWIYFRGEIHTEMTTRETIRQEVTDRTIGAVEYLNVYLGGRQVLSYNNIIDGVNEYIPGTWMDFLDLLAQGKTNRTLTELVKMEARQNAAKLGKYQKLCLGVAMKLGDEEETNNGYQRSYEAILDGVGVSIVASHGTDYDEVSLRVDGGLVFQYFWDGPAGGLFDAKGSFAQWDWEETIKDFW